MFNSYKKVCLNFVLKIMMTKTKTRTEIWNLSLRILENTRTVFSFNFLFFATIFKIVNKEVILYFKCMFFFGYFKEFVFYYLNITRCLIKFLVPRYENAAKSNFWTMNQEGFEEFGTECSFKRRRRRGQTMPISLSF